MNWWWYYHSLGVSRVLKYPKKCLEDLTTSFMSTWWGDSKNMEEIEFSRWLLKGRPRQGKSLLPDGLNWLCYFTGSSKSHLENSISCIFLESPHQLGMKDVVKSSKHFFWLFQYSRNSQCNCSDKTGLNSFYTSQKRTWTVCYQRSEIFFQKLVWF